MRTIDTSQLRFPDTELSINGITLPTVPIDDSFPEEDANTIASLESYNKHLYRPNTYLHKWWARRSGSTFRFILKQLVTDPLKKDYYKAGGLENTTILDPMMGGGTTLHEATRLNANCIGIDIDPIPVLQVKASLQHQPLQQLKNSFNLFMSRLTSLVGPFFKTHCPYCNASSEIQFTLYALRRRCRCREVAILDSYILRREESKTISICPYCRKAFTGSHICDHVDDEHTSLLERTAISCPLCGEKYHDLNDVPFYERYIPLVLVGHCDKHGQFFKSLDSHDNALIGTAERALIDAPQLFPSDFSVPNGQKSDDLLRRGVHSYIYLFTRRQILYLTEAIRLMHEVSEKDKLWLSLLISTSTEFNSILCGYKGADIRRPGAIRHVFSHHAYSFPYTAVENNPLSRHGTSGTLIRLFRDRIEKANHWASSPTERAIFKGKLEQIHIYGETDSANIVNNIDTLQTGNKQAYVAQGDSSQLHLPPESVDHVVTDPPYFDSVQYSDLSMFFRVWLKQLLPNYADWDYDTRLSVVATNPSDGEYYGNLLTSIWKNCYTALKKPHGRLVFTFHHWNPNAWSELTLSLKRAKFTLMNCFVVFSENPISVHIRDLKALKHDCILVLKPKTNEYTGQATRWLLPEKLGLTDSRLFCISCGNALGFLLDSELSEDKIRETWDKLLRSENGKTTC